jgi:hypothetical protein
MKYTRITKNGIIETKEEIEGNVDEIRVLLDYIDNFEEIYEEEE